MSITLRYFSCLCTTNVSGKCSNCVSAAHRPHLPADYVLLCVDAVCGVTRTTREHLAVAVALEVPTALVVTKADAIDSKQLQAVLEQLRELMAPVLDYCKDCSSGDVSSPADASAADGAAEFAGAFASDATGTPVVVGEAQAARLAAILSDLHSCTAAGTAASFQQVTFPVFTVSCVSGVGLPLLHAFLSKLRPVSTSARSQGVPSDWPSHSASATKPVVLDPGQHAQAEPPLLAEDQLQADHCEVPQQQQQHLATAGNSRLWLPFDAGLPTNTSSSDSVTTPVASTSSVVPAVIASTAAAMPAAVCHQAGHFQVVHTYDVQGVGWVVSGIAVAGEHWATLQHWLVHADTKGLCMPELDMSETYQGCVSPARQLFHDACGTRHCTANRQTSESAWSSGCIADTYACNHRQIVCMFTRTCRCPNDPATCLQW